MPTMVGTVCGRYELTSPVVPVTPPTVRRSRADALKAERKVIVSPRDHADEAVIKCEVITRPLTRNRHASVTISTLAALGVSDVSPATTTSGSGPHIAGRGLLPGDDRGIPCPCIVGQKADDPKFCDHHHAACAHNDNKMGS